MLSWLILFFRIPGLGGNFSAGYDLGELAKIEKEDIANELVRYFLIYELPQMAAWALKWMYRIC